MLSDRSRNPLKLTQADITLLEANTIPANIIDLLNSDQMLSGMADIMLSFELTSNQELVSQCGNQGEALGTIGIFMTWLFALKVMNPIREQNGVACRIDTQVMAETSSLSTTEANKPRSLLTFKNGQFFFKPENEQYKDSFVQLQETLTSQRAMTR
jgi:hypothetical protein